MESQTEAVSEILSEVRKGRGEEDFGGIGGGGVVDKQQEMQELRRDVQSIKGILLSR